MFTADLTLNLHTFEASFSDYSTYSHPISIPKKILLLTMENFYPFTLIFSEKKKMFNGCQRCSCLKLLQFSFRHTRHTILRQYKKIVKTLNSSIRRQARLPFDHRADEINVQKLRSWSLK